ncbi:hypothetical protein EC988_001082 [Linderina pennispora]|nr:hypothetical protein EC988_001082 [Linderina pennispora]
MSTSNKIHAHRPTRLLTDAKSYKLWLAELKLQLMYSGLLPNVMDPKSLEPNEKDSEATAQKKRDDKEKSDAEAQYMIMMTLPYETAAKVMDMSPSRTMEYLRDAYGDETLTDQALEIISILSMKQGPTQNIVEYVLEGLNSIEAMSNRSLPMEKVAIIAMLNGVRSDCVALRERFLMVNPEDLSKKEVLLGAKNMMKFQENFSSQSKAMASIAMAKTQVVVCQLCDTAGHSAKTCSQQMTQQATSSMRKLNISGIAYWASSASTAESWTTDSTLDLHSLNNWVLDSGASVCSTPHDNFTEFEASQVDAMVDFAGNVNRCYGKGKVTISDGSNTLEITNVHHVPNSAMNLLSVSRLTANGNQVLFDGDNAYLYKDGKVQGAIQQTDGLYIIKPSMLDNLSLISLPD